METERGLFRDAEVTGDTEHPCNFMEPKIVSDIRLEGLTLISICRCKAV